MSKKRGLSLEEKRTRMLEIFYEKKEVFQLKELEKIGPQEKGIVSQSVKEVVQSLVDDGYVDSERIGTSIYFWAFPSKATQVRKTKLENMKMAENECAMKLESIAQETNRAKLSRNETPEREEMIAKLQSLKAEQERLNELLLRYQDSDPDVIDKERRETKAFSYCANRWTENIFSYRSFLINRFSMLEADLNRMFEIPEDFDYLEEV